MANSTQQGVNRREFLVRSATLAGGAFLSIGVPPSVIGGGEAQAAMGSTPSFTPSIWFTMTPDGMTTMHIIKAEMGQHIGTAFAQIIADELELPWDKVRLDTPLESVDNFAIYGLAYTVNSGSVTTEFDRISRADALQPIGETAQVLGVYSVLKPGQGRLGSQVGGTFRGSAGHDLESRVLS